MYASRYAMKTAGTLSTVSNRRCTSRGYANLDLHDSGQERSDYDELPCAADVDGIEEICRYCDQNGFDAEVNAGDCPPASELARMSVMQICRTCSLTHITRAVCPAPLKKCTAWRAIDADCHSRDKRPDSCADQECIANVPALVGGPRKKLSKKQKHTNFSKA